MRVEPEPDALEPDDPDDPEPVLLDPEFELLEPDEGVVVEEFVLAPELVEPVDPVFEVVAALATSAPPVTSPAVNAPVASTLRNRILIGCLPFVGAMRHPVRGGLHTMRPGPVAGRTTTATCRLRFLTIG